MYLYVYIHLFGEFVVQEKNIVWIVMLPRHQIILKNAQLDWTSEWIWAVGVDDAILIKWRQYHQIFYLTWQVPVFQGPGDLDSFMNIIQPIPSYSLLW